MGDASRSRPRRIRSHLGLNPQRWLDSNKINIHPVYSYDNTCSRTNDETNNNTIIQCILVMYTSTVRIIGDGVSDCKTGREQTGKQTTRGKQTRKKVTESQLKNPNQYAYYSSNQ